MPLTVRADSAVVGRLLRLMLGVPLPPEKPAAIAAWEDDGGPWRPDYDGYDHVIRASA